LSVPVITSAPPRAASTRPGPAVGGARGWPPVTGQQRADLSDLADRPLLVMVGAQCDAAAC